MHLNDADDQYFTVIQVTGAISYSGDQSTLVTQVTSAIR